MKLYDTHVAPNPRRVRLFAAEKGIELGSIPIDLMKGEHRTPGFLAKNPMGKVPVLELDDGTHLAESLAICEYLEELVPEPALIGSSIEERARVRMWERRMELEVMLPLLDAFRHSSSFFAGKMKQFPDYADACRETAAARLTWLDGELQHREFIAGSRFSVADITLWCALDFALAVGESYDASALGAVARWHAAMRARPTAKA
jgi:glutathione S-transferase